MSAEEPAMPTAAELLAATDRPDGPDRPGRPSHPHGAMSSLGAALGVSEPADARALREAADAETGVRTRSCLIRRDEEAGTTTVVMSVAVAYGLTLREVADRVRKRVLKAVPKTLGVRAKTVTVDVKIVWIDEPGAATDAGS